jgi:hypothetical protein
MKIENTDIEYGIVDGSIRIVNHSENTTYIVSIFIEDHLIEEQVVEPNTFIEFMKKSITHKLLSEAVEDNKNIKVNAEVKDHREESDK